MTDRLLGVTVTFACEPACPFHEHQGAGESTLVSSGPSGLVGAEFDADLRRRHADCHACAGLGWVVQGDAGGKVLCRREPPF